jgi:hypothetical protein
MKKLLALLVASAFIMPVMAADAPKETKKVCVEVKDKQGQPVKDAKGNVKQSCRDVKVHKKHEGTEVPEKKK